MKTNLLKSIFISLILLVGATNAWAYNYGGTNVYYYFANTASWSSVHLYIWNGDWNTDFTLTKIANTNVYYHKWSSAYNGNEGILFRGAADWSHGQTGDIKADYTSHTSWVQNSTDGKTDLSNINRQAQVAVKLSTGGNYTQTANANCVAKVSGYTVVAGNSSATAKNASTSGSSATASISAAYGSTITYTATAGTGYTFKGFSTSNSTSLPSSPSASGKTATASAYGSSNNSTYYAYFKANSYTVKFDANGGTGSMSNQSHTYGVSKALTANAFTKTGYNFTGWNTAADGTGTKYTDKQNVSNLSSTDGATVTLYAQWTPATYTITYKDQGNVKFSGSHASGYPTKHTYGTATTLSTATKTGYTFGGWHTDAACTNNVTSLGATAYTAAITLYAEWTANTYTVTLDQEGAAVKGDASATATYDAALPQLKQVPTAQNGYAFMGYWDAKDYVDGKQYYNAGGTSVANWDKADNATLYAYFKKAEISEITLDKAILDPVPAGGSGSVTATATVAPKPVGDFVICWQLLYSNGDPVAGHDPAVDDNSATFSIAGLETGNYMIRATLRTGTSCNGGTELHTLDQNFTIAANFTVTVRYTCDGKTIAAPTKHTGHATNPTEITAQEIGGYDFKEWILGDGIYSTSTLTQKTIEYTATYDGYLTATYQKKKLIFLDISTLPNKEKWTAPHIYLYKGAKNENTGGYWNDQTGAGGATGGNYITHAAMTKVPNTENIWYFDYEQYTNNFNVFVAFTSNNQGNVTHFANCEAIYRTEFSSGTPVFVPESNQTAETKNSTAKYYSKGYWVKYMDGTGYWMIIYNAEGNKELVRREFTSETQRMTMTSIVDLEAEHTYKYEIYRNDDYYYKGGDITYTNSSNYKPLNEANKHSINTTESGDYTFTLDYSAGDLQIKVQYPVEVGDYRILYTDDVRAGKYKPSQVISQNNKEPLVSFFVRPNNNPILKIQKATLVTEEEVKWDNNVLYLTPNSNWKADGARFAAAFLNNNKTQTKWVSMTSIKNGDYYGCAIPTGTWKYVIFCRMNGSTTENNWDNKWNQTDDLEIPKDGTNQYTVKSGTWDKGGGNWSKHDNDIIDLSTALKEKLGELDLTNIKENEGSVFNIHLSNNSGTPTIEKVALYTGNYYIRVDAVDGKWYDYKTNPDNLMTYSAFSESDANSFGEKFSHYKTKWCPRGTNVKFVIANDYSLCISDTIARDLSKASGKDGEDYMTEGGDLYQEDGGSKDPVDDRFSANIRFMWNRKTNKISRAYLASSSNDSRQFLVLKGCQEIKDENGNNLSGNCALLQDRQDWIYERTFMVQPGTRVKLYACYANTTVDPAKAQYFRGAYDSNQCGSTENSVQILGGSDKTKWEKIRVIYDFKTNRLIGAWVPSGEISKTQTIAADVMIMRNHQEDATCITLAQETSLTDVKTVYGTLRFNRWTLNNKDANSHQPLPVAQQQTIYERGLYFISFPFDVHLSDAFGLGTYGTHWVISTYNGKRRAERGYFAEDCINEDCTNWDYIWDPTDFVMEANVGYLLSLDLELMKDNDESFWPNNINYRELLFPSQVELATITKTNYTMPKLGQEYEYKINLNTTGTEPEKDRRVKDSYWRCIGVPSFADYSGLLTDSLDKTITWQPNGNELPFLYEWNVTNNNLVVRSATNYRFRPTFAYLIQNGSEINWTLVSTKPNPIIARERSEATSNYEWKIALLRNGNTEDQTFVRVTDDETVTAAFDFNQDLAKEFNYGANIYTLVGYERLAANSLPMSDSTTIIPLGVSAQEAGDYTITMPEGVESIGITLVDTETGTRTNLSAGMEYTFTLNRGTYDSRLYLEISPIEKTPSDLEYVDEATRNQNVRKFIIDGKLYLQKDGMLYDAQGHIVR